MAIYVVLFRYDNMQHGVRKVGNKFHPYNDFTEKGTLSNVTQDPNTVRGRMWTVGLVLNGFMTLLSMYSYHLYRVWAPWHSYETNPMVHQVFTSR